MSASRTLNCLKITLLLVYLDASVGWSFSVGIKKNGVDREFSGFFKKFVFSTKSYTEEGSILFNASESTYSDVNNWIENALKLAGSAYSTMYCNFVLSWPKFQLVLLFFSCWNAVSRCLWLYLYIAPPRTGLRTK